MMPSTTTIGIKGPGISMAAEAYTATIGIINMGSLSAYRYQNPHEV